MIFNDVQIRDRYADDEMRNRVTEAANAFAEKHRLDADQVRAIYANTDNPLFDELDGAMRQAATEDFADQTYSVGEIIL